MHFQPARLFPFLLLFSGCVSTSGIVPQAWLSVPQAPRIGSLSLADDGTVTTSAAAQPAPTAIGTIRIADPYTGPKLANGEQILTETFRAIDSFDVSESRGEVVFSAKKTDNFDIGLVAVDGSPIVWVPADPADEVQVQWAPKGSKISYVIRAPGGDVVRTLHVPTSFQFGVDFPNATIHALAWSPDANRYAVAYSTPLASDQVEVLPYSGEQRRIAVPAAVTLEVELERLAPGVILLRPRDLRYDERLPLVVWRADDFRWSDARAALIRQARVALVIATRDFDWELVRRPWIDAERAFVVGSAAPGGGESVVSIVPDEAVPDGRYRRSGNVVAVAPAVVQSFAPGFIADQLKRNPPANGSSR